MADENGKDLKNYTRLSNAIIKALYADRFNGTDYSILLYIIRSTYGWQKKCDAISPSQIADNTNLPLRNVKRAIKGLMERNVVIKYGMNKDSHCNVYGINKKTSEWLPRGGNFGSGKNGQKGVANLVNGEWQNLQKGSGQFATHKTNKNKDIFTKENKKKKKAFFSSSGYEIKELDEMFGYYFDNDGSICREEKSKLTEREVDG